MLVPNLRIDAPQMFGHRVRGMWALPALAGSARPSHLNALPGGLINGFPQVERAGHAVNATYIRETLRVADETIPPQDLLVVLFLIRLFVPGILGYAVDGMLDELVGWLPDVAGHRVDDNAGDESIQPVKGI